MTILVGVICSDAILLAADSQFTDGIGRIWPNEQVLVAQAGLPAITNRIVEIMQRNAKSVVIKEALTVTKIAEDAIRELKNELDEEQWTYGQHAGGAEVMLAFYANRKPCLYTLNVYGHGVAETAIPSHYATAGAGASVADYLLAEIAEAGLPHSVAAATVIYVIKKVKERLKGSCGGETKIKALGLFSQSSLENPITDILCLSIKHRRTKRKKSFVRLIQEFKKL